jgi:RNA polymerase sigma-70 factor (ECF subfamily)
MAASFNSISRQPGDGTRAETSAADAADASGARPPGHGKEDGDGTPRASGNGNGHNGGGGGDGAGVDDRMRAAAAIGRTDEQLLDAYRRGDRQSFADLVSRYQRELYHFLVRFLGNRVSAEDVFQETFLQVHQSAEQFDPQRRFRPWLFTIAANKARDLIRSQARRPTNPLQASISPGDDESGEFIDLMKSVTASPSDPMEREELQQQVQRTVAGMPDHLREILLLSYFHAFPYRQISEVLEIPLGTVKSRLHAAVAHFADRWRSANRDRPGSVGS